MSTKNNSAKRGLISSSINIMRPVNCIMGSLTVIIGLLNTRTGIPLNILLINIILGVLTYFFAAGSGVVSGCSQAKKKLKRAGMNVNLVVQDMSYSSWILNLGNLHLVIIKFVKQKTILDLN